MHHHPLWQGFAVEVKSAYIQSKAAVVHLKTFPGLSCGLCWMCGSTDIWCQMLSGLVQKSIFSLEVLTLAGLSFRHSLLVPLGLMIPDEPTVRESVIHAPGSSNSHLDLHLDASGVLVLGLPSPVSFREPHLAS